MITAALLCLAAQTGSTFIVETEAFDDLGGWVLDQQFMDLMGSPFLLAHGMGTPVGDARTSVETPAAGKYRVWARTRDWVAPWGVEGAPGRFQVVVDGIPLAAEFGTEGDLWHWQDGGVVELGASFDTALRDLTGFDGRCDALLFSADLDWEPPHAGDALERLRDQLAGRPTAPSDGGTFDLVVVGGGTAGTCAAITAARLGLDVALVQDRPVLGGNSSSEVRVWPEGHVNQEPFPRVGDVVMEVVPVRGPGSANAQMPSVFDDDRKLRVARAEPNLTLFLECRMNGADVKEGRIRTINIEDVRSGERRRLRGTLFADCTGDGSLGALAGADFEMTRTKHMGASNLWNIRCLCQDEDPLSSELTAACDNATFPRCPWAVDLTERPFPGRESGPTVAAPEAGVVSLGNWFWESGFDRHPIDEMERVRDQNLRAAYGAWDAIKNVEKRYPAHRLNWVAYIAGKRESRRLLGDVVLSADDLRDGKSYPDGCVPCTWGIDTHFPHTAYDEGHDGDEFIADYTHGDGYVYEGPYWVPYRCLYSRNISNLFMAGRDISVTHEALGAVRVMKTTGAMGEIVGMAAAICDTHDCGPRAVYSDHLAALLKLMEEGAGKLPLVNASADGSMRLAGATAALRGPQLAYESALDAIGYWRSEGAHAVWMIDVTKASTYGVDLVLSCADTEASGQCTIEVSPVASTDGDATDQVLLKMTVEGTGGWETFVDQRAGEIQLAQGRHRIKVVNRKQAGPLMKLRSVRLTQR